MLPAIKYFNVNWVDGMKLTKDHFADQEHAFTDRLRDLAGIFLTSYNYGLLAAAPGRPTALSHTIDIDRANLLRVNVSECRAITRGGARIEISPVNPFIQNKTAEGLNAEYDLGSSAVGKVLYVVISVNPFARTPLGQPDASENPPRYPYTDSKYEINIIPAEEIAITSNGAFHITIGKLKVTGANVEVIEKYIPPCAKVANHRDLLDIYQDLDKVLSRVEADSVLIVQKIHRKDQQNLLAKAVLTLSEAIVTYLGANINQFRWLVPEMPPIVMVEYFANFARVVKNAIDIKAGTGKEEMLTYFKDWIVEVNQGEFEAILDEMVNIQYDHMDINASIEKIEAFSITLSTVINKLSKLDYIGDKKKSEVIVTSREAEVSNAPKKRSFLLD
ncbi:MAG: hypothetical protein SFW35_06695 [Chitinophagales bacterium]|nr:hypothetical protein [Chitinophagales bacterium]